MLELNLCGWYQQSLEAGNILITSSLDAELANSIFSVVYNTEKVILWLIISRKLIYLTFWKINFKPAAFINCFPINIVYNTGIEPGGSRGWSRKLARPASGTYFLLFGGVWRLSFTWLIGALQLAVSISKVSLILSFTFTWKGGGQFWWGLK